MTGSRPRPVPALEAARALAGTSQDGRQLEALAELLAGGDWDAARAWHTLLHGGLAPLAARVFEQHGLLSVFDERMAHALRSAQEVNALRNAMLRRAAIEASRALSQRGITPLWAKGLWLAHYVYEQPSLRQMADIDLIVPEGRRPAAVNALLDIGYTLDPSQNDDGAASWTDTLSLPCNLPGGATSVQIDLHDVIRVSAGRAWPAARLWESSSCMRVGGVAVQLPTVEAGLLYLAAHLFKHGFDLRHALVAIEDAVVLLRTRGASLDVEWMARHLHDPRDATALYMLLAQIGVMPTPAAQALFESTRERVMALGMLSTAHAVIGSASRLTLSSDTDFSLFDVGEQNRPWRSVARLAGGALRWRKRVEGHSSTAIGSNSLARLVGRANWRYAYTTYLAGRLNARLEQRSH